MEQAWYISELCRHPALQENLYIVYLNTNGWSCGVKNPTMLLYCWCCHCFCFAHLAGEHSRMITQLYLSTLMYLVGIVLYAGLATHGRKERFMCRKYESNTHSLV